MFRDSKKLLFSHDACMVQFVVECPKVSKKSRARATRYD